MTAENVVTELVDAIDKSIAKVNKAILVEKADALSPTFEPNTKLGEGKASKRNLEYRKKLLTLLKDTVYTPVQGMLKKSMEQENRITFVDKSISDYIDKGWKLIETEIPSSYKAGSDMGTGFAKKAAEKKGIKYTVKTTGTPKRVTMMINMQKRTLEDKALVLRGRLRSSIDTEAWMKTYGNSPA